MARRSKFFGSPKTIVATTAQTLQWTSSELPGEGIIAYHLGLEGAGNVLTDIDRIRLQANGQNIFNCTPVQLRAYIQQYSHGRIQIPSGGNYLMIPLMMLDAMTPDAQDVSQFPFNSQVQLEIAFNTGTAAGQAVVGYTQTNIAPKHFPVLLSHATNIQPSSANGVLPFQENGIVRGIGLVQNGIERLRLSIAGQNLIDMPGEDFQGNASQANLLAESESVWGNGPSQAGTPLTTEIFHRVNAGKPATQESSFIELETSAAWATTNELTVYGLRPNDPALANA